MPRNTLPQPPRLRTPTRIPQGSRTYRYGQPARQVVGGPGDAPAGFVLATNSLSEWWCYWAMRQATGEPKDPRQPPFIGSPPVWSYQDMGFGGRNIGGGVPDFVYWRTATGRPLIVRVQSEKWHLTAGPAYAARDVLQRASFERTADVVDVYEQDFLQDRTGQAVVRVIKGALGMIESNSPLTSGTFRRVS